MQFSPFIGLALAGAAIFPGLPAAAEAVDARPANATPQAVVDFWREAGPARWFAKDPAFDARFRTRFLAAHEAAARGELDSWSATPEGSLALLILLDQFPRNAFRGTPRMYATDDKARAVARAAVEAGHMDQVDRSLRTFLVLPFAHSEDQPDQERSVQLARRLGEPDLGNAERHRGIIYRFGRFPHRNVILGRPTTPEEARYLERGGYLG